MYFTFIVTVFLQKAVSHVFQLIPVKEFESITDKFGPQNNYFKTQETQGLQISKSTIFRCGLCLSFVKPRPVGHVLLGVPLLHFSINLEITHNNDKNDKNNGEDSLCYERKPISYKNSLHFDTWIQNSKKDKLL